MLMGADEVLSEMSVLEGNSRITGIFSYFLLLLGLFIYAVSFLTMELCYFSAENPFESTQENTVSFLSMPLKKGLGFNRFKSKLSCGI